MNIKKLLPVACLLALTGCGVTVSGGVGLNTGLNGLNGSNGQLRPSQANYDWMMNQRCPYGTTPVSDTGFVAGSVDQQVDARTNWRPNRWGRGGNRNNSPYGLGTVRRDTFQEFTRTLTCGGPQGLVQRTVGVEVRRLTDSFRGANWDERPIDTRWQLIRQQNSYRR
jgi:hypothetical protein